MYLLSSQLETEHGYSTLQVNFSTRMVWAWLQAKLWNHTQEKFLQVSAHKTDEVQCLKVLTEPDCTRAHFFYASANWSVCLCLCLIERKSIQKKCMNNKGNKSKIMLLAVAYSLIYFELLTDINLNSKLMSFKSS